ncbi:MAG: alpha-galactosidase [Muribaculaceae bacterium]|nr:alpha-galactosidase [Muribaculaceae bacterium]
MNLRNLFISLSLATAHVVMAGDCYSILSGDTLRMGNDLIERVYLWNDGHLITCRVTDKQSGKTLMSDGSRPDFAVNRAEPSDGRMTVRNVDSDGIRPAHTVVTITYRLGDLDVERSYRLYDGVPAIAVDTRLRGTLSGVAEKELSAADRSNIEHAEDMKVKPVTAVLDRLSLPGSHWHGRAVEFRDITDWNNNLVDTRDFISYRKTNYRGNILSVTDGVNGGGFIFLKEAPCSGVQLAYNGGDFISDFGSFMVTGIGVTDKDVTPDKWTSTYSTVLCTYDGGELEALKALRGYQKQCRVLDPGRDEMVMMNTWGDRSQDAKVNEAFCLAELERASRLGISLFQIDDGWQAGKSPNSATAGGSFKDIYANADYWTPDPVKYPRGLTPIVERGRELGIEIGLWFNPSVQNDFADWEKDAATIVGLWRKYCIRMFKIDGLTVTSKTGEENLRRLFDRVLADTDNSVMFNLDATASRRGGYHFFNEYGNIFLENRYTDWGNYYPYWTLRNLWLLSRYVPAEKLQIEFLNKWRNVDKYSDDPFAPGTYDFGYLFATTMAGQPLAWFEASNLPDEAFSIKPLVDAYRAVQHDFHSGVILPVGNEPDGRSWTGFQSITGNNEGYLLLYRELNDAPRGSVSTWLPEEAKVKLTRVLGNGKNQSLKVGRDGVIDITIDRPNDFVMYKYITTFEK